MRGHARVLGDEAAPYTEVRSALAGAGIAVDGGVHPDVVVLVHADGDPRSRIEAARRRHPAVPILFITSAGCECLAVSAFRAGIGDYLRWPATAEDLAAAWARLASAAAGSGDALLLGDSASMQRVRQSVHRLAQTPCNVLICGETGTGKEVTARMLHQESRRRDAPFVPINCSAVPDTLFESELFGYERGAFTGAIGDSPGRLQQARGGTVFLDEIAELSLAVQPKLLRAIEQREVQSLGGRKAAPIDVRWICASNRDLDTLTRDGRFRADLYYRLNVCAITLPPLRERCEDIAILASAFARDLGTVYGRPGAGLTGAALDRLVAYPWPGNVRELRNAVEHGLIQSNGSEIDVEALPPAISGLTHRSPSHGPLERDHLIEALRAAGGNKSAAAHRLHWSRMTLYRKLARYRIAVTDLSDR